MANARMLAGLLILCPISVMSFTALPLATTGIARASQFAQLPLARSAGIARITRSVCGAGSALKMQEKGGFDVETMVAKVGP